MEGDKEEHLNYVNVDLAKIKARSEGDLEDGAIRGLASKTAKYAEICVQCRESDEDAKEPVNFSGTHLGQGKDANDPTEEVTEMVNA